MALPFGLEMLRILYQLEEAVLPKQARLVQFRDGLAFFLLVILRLALAVNAVQWSATFPTVRVRLVTRSC